MEVGIDFVDRVGVIGDNFCDILVLKMLEVKKLRR